MKIGGQAVIEGVMMRNNDRFAVAVRKPDKTIEVWKQESKYASKLLKIPFVRGVVGLGYHLYDGVRALVWSGNKQAEDEEEELSKKEIIGTIVVSFLFAALIFVAAPFFAARWLHGEGIWFDVLDGLFRVLFFVGYLYLISFMADVKRLFMYHGAEHMAIMCYERGGKLTVEGVKKYSRLNVRCGTSFLFVVLIMSIFFYSFINGSWMVELAGRLLLLPVIAGVSYELIKLGDKFPKSIVLKVLTYPGILLQKITTSDPTDDQIEVAIASIKAVVE